MTDEERIEFKRLLHKICDELDQWEYYKITSLFGPVYVGLSRYHFDGTNDDHYIPLERPEEAGWGTDALSN